MKTYTKNITGELLEIDTNEVSHTYTLEFLNQQKIILEASLAEVNALIVEAQNAGVVLKVNDII